MPLLPPTPKRPVSRSIRKRPVNLTIREDLADEAKTFGTNMSAVLERGLEAEHREARRLKWREENREAIARWDAWLDENGIPFESLRPW